MSNTKDYYSYKVVSHLMEGYRDFIVLGLCGKTGSGVSTIANILSQNFEDLQLPLPGFAQSNLYNEHEYRISYTYAKKKWIPMYKVKTSALISRKIMENTEEDFAKFIKKLIKKIKKRKCKEYAKEFFNKKMEFKLDSYKEYYKVKKHKKKLTINKIYGKENKEIGEISIKPKKGKKYYCEVDEGKSKVKFIYNEKERQFEFKNKQLSDLMDNYSKLREEKSGFKNEFFYLILKQYVYESLPMFSREFWKKISRLKNGANTIALQCLANNLRFCRSPYFTNGKKKEEKEEGFKEDGYTLLAEEINLAIKVLGAGLRCISSNQDKEENKIIVVIDSIKNPYESLYLKRRYNNYFLIGVYTEDEERHSRIREGGDKFENNRIEAIDMIEDIKELERCIKKPKEKKSNKFAKDILKYLESEFGDQKTLDILPFVSQNIKDSLESADIFINNIKDDSAYMNLKHVLLRYVCLIMNPGLLLPTDIERCMQIAYTAKLNSGCISRQVGAVITDGKYHLLSIGWNQQPERELPCSYRDLCEARHHWSPKAYSDFENDNKGEFQKRIADMVEEYFDESDNPLSQNGKLPCFCFKDIHNTILKDKNQVHARSLHAEETAFLNLGKNGIQLLEKGILFTTSSPCELCSKKAMYTGIRKIYYAQVYSGISFPHVLSAGPKEKRPDVILFTGAIGEGYTKLFTPAFSRKDENKMWCGGKIEDLEFYKENQKKKKGKKNNGKK